MRGTRYEERGAGKEVRGKRCEVRGTGRRIEEKKGFEFWVKKTQCICVGEDVPVLPKIGKEKSHGPAQFTVQSKPHVMK